MTKYNDDIHLSRQLRGIPDDDGRVIVVSGAPGSGKTHYVKENKTDNDLVIDMDYLCAALNASDGIYGNHNPVLGVACEVRDFLYDTVSERKGEWDKCYIVTASKDKEEVDRITQRLRGTNVAMTTDLNQCLKNIDSDARRTDKETFRQLAENWFDD